MRSDRCAVRNGASALALRASTHEIRRCRVTPRQFRYSQSSPYADTISQRNARTVRGSGASKGSLVLNKRFIAMKRAIQIADMKGFAGVSAKLVGNSVSSTETVDR